jgi:hypothetical protein
MKIEVHHLTKNPTAAWNELSKIQKVIRVQVNPPKSHVADDKVRHAFGVHFMWLFKNHYYILIGVLGYQNVKLACVNCHSMNRKHSYFSKNNFETMLCLLIATVCWKVNFDLQEDCGISEQWACMCLKFFEFFCMFTTNYDTAGKYLKLLSIFKARNLVILTSSVFVFNLKVGISLGMHCLG